MREGVFQSWGLDCEWGNTSVEGSRRRRKESKRWRHLGRVISAVRLVGQTIAEPLEQAIGVPLGVELNQSGSVQVGLGWRLSGRGWLGSAWMSYRHRHRRRPACSRGPQLRESWHWNPWQRRFTELLFRRKGMPISLLSEKGK